MHVRSIEKGCAKLADRGDGPIVVTALTKFRHPTTAQAERRHLPSKLTCKDRVCITGYLEISAIVGS